MRGIRKFYWKLFAYAYDIFPPKIYLKILLGVICIYICMHIHKNIHMFPQKCYYIFHTIQENDMNKIYLFVLLRYTPTCICRYLSTSREATQQSNKAESNNKSNNKNNNPTKGNATCSTKYTRTN